MRIDHTCPFTGVILLSVFIIDVTGITDNTQVVKSRERHGDPITTDLEIPRLGCIGQQMLSRGDAATHTYIQYQLLTMRYST